METTSTADLLKGLIQSGGNPADTSDASSASDVDSDDVSRAENSTVDDLLPNNGEDTPTDSSAEENSESANSDLKPAAQKTSGESKEVITVTDESGKRRKIEIDYSNRESVKKAFTMAAGMRKFQAERDQALTKLKPLESELGEIKSNWNILEKAYQSGGVEGLVDLLEGRKGAYKDSVQKHIDRARFLENASPEEIRELERRELSEKQNSEFERIRKENEEFKKQILGEKETAELRSLESQVNPVFEKYRFADRLGNADNEHIFDDMLWNSALKRLEPYEERGVPVTPEMIEREFRTVALSLRKTIGLQAEKKASKAIEQKKQEATENVQAKVMSGYKTDGAAKEARDLIQSGNLTGLLKGWNKYGGLFNNKK